MKKIFKNIFGGTHKYPVTSGFNAVRSYGLHRAIDLGCPVGTPLYAPWSGEVEASFYSTKGGNSLMIYHPHNGYTTGYAHLSYVYVQPGEMVKAGDLIADTGNTGNTTGPHLHFTMRNALDERIDPLPYYDGSYNKQVREMRIKHAGIGVGFFSLLLAVRNIYKEKDYEKRSPRKRGRSRS